MDRRVSGWVWGGGSLPLGNSDEIVAHRISLIQGNEVVDLLDLFSPGGGDNATAADVAALQAKDAELDSEISALQASDNSTPGTR